MGRQDENKWINLELDGYGHDLTVSQLEKVLPNYRNARCMYFDQFDRPIRIAENLSMLEEFPLPQSVAELEECIENGLHMYAGPTINFIIERFHVPVHRGFVSPVAIRRVLNQVSNRVLDFLNSTILALEYTQIQSDVFEKARSYVDKQLVMISRPTLEKLVETYGQLTRTKTPLECSQIAFACREILQDFTDAIFKPEYVRPGEAKPDHEQTKNKLRLALRETLAQSKEKETGMLVAEVEYLNAYFDRLTSYLQKHVHPKGFETTPDDADRCVIHTYLVIWDVIRLMESSQTISG
jgi:hypothetical protein